MLFRSHAFNGSRVCQWKECILLFVSVLLLPAEDICDLRFFPALQLPDLPKYNWGSLSWHGLIDDDCYYYHNHHHYYYIRLLLLGWPCSSRAFGPDDSLWCLPAWPILRSPPVLCPSPVQAGGAPEVGFLSRLFNGAWRAPPRIGGWHSLSWWNHITPFYCVRLFVKSGKESGGDTLAGSTGVARTLWHLQSILKYASFKCGFVFPIIFNCDFRLFSILKWTGGSFFKLTPQSFLTWDAEFLGLLH